MLSSVVRFTRRPAASFGRLIWLAAINMLSSAHSSQAPFQRQLGISLRKRRAMNKIVVSSAVGIAAGSLFAGCASIINGRNADVAIDSNPRGAHVVVHDNNGREVASLNTPGVVSLKRNRRYFLPARYTATIEAPGYAPAEVAIRSSVNPWVLGNIVVGGVPGLIVDNATGAAWKPSQSEIHRQLTPLGNEQSPMISSTPPAPDAAVRR